MKYFRDSDLKCVSTRLRINTKSQNPSGITTNKINSNKNHTVL